MGGTLGQLEGKTMKTCALSCLSMLAAVGALAEEPLLAVELLPGHPIHRAAAAEAGAVMGLTIGQGGSSTSLEALCDELRVAAGLSPDNGRDLPLEVVFVVPYKAMAIEGFYLPANGTADLERLVPGSIVVERVVLDSIVARAGMPPSLLDETGVEHEISCETKRPSWLLRWEDVRSLDGEAPEVVIERAYARFIAIHQAVVEHAGQLPKLAKL
jgi:hypothetical protein